MTPSKSQTDWNILVVDDRIENADLLATLLQCEGYEHIKVASSGEEALERIEGDEAKGKPVDLIFLDYQMPGMNGVDVCRKIREGKSTKDILVVMVTAEDNMSTLKNAFDAGATDFIMKPLKTNSLLVRLNFLFHMKQERDRCHRLEAALKEKSDELKRLKNQQES